MSFIDQAYQRIQDAPRGTAFVASDFVDLMDYETAKKSLSRLERKGELRRVLRGIYDRPEFSRLIQEYAAPNPDGVAHALARNYNWTIAPTGNSALNLLGLSTQVPSNWAYISSGPYKTYLLDRVTLDFSHRANRELTGMSPKTILVIQALKALGKDRVSTNDRDIIRSRLDAQEVQNLLTEGRGASSWIYEEIKKICQEG